MRAWKSRLWKILSRRYPSQFRNQCSLHWCWPSPHHAVSGQPWHPDSGCPVRLKCSSILPLETSSSSESQLSSWLCEGITFCCHTRNAWTWVRTPCDPRLSMSGDNRLVSKGYIFSPGSWWGPQFANAHEHIDKMKFLVVSASFLFFFLGWSTANGRLVLMYWKVAFCKAMLYFFFFF